MNADRYLVTRRHYDPSPTDPNGFICASCAGKLQKARDQPRPIRCRFCLFAEPHTFARFYPTDDAHHDRRRMEKLPDAVKWWSHHRIPGLALLMTQIARRVDTGNTSGRASEIFAACTFDETENTFERRLTCAAFVDEFGHDLELLIVSWCSSRRT
jgi:hypothetical protein